LLTKPQINAIVRRWQKKFGLTNWKITVVLVSTPEELSGCAGTLEWETEYHAATMRLVSELPKADMEETIIHEFIHLLLEGHKSTSGRYDAMYERGLNTLSSVLAKR
jgi:hypothetical protein